MTAPATRPMAAGRELDAEIAEKVMGLSLDVPRPRALAIVGTSHVDSTGREFSVNPGEGPPFLLPMPDWQQLPGHESDYNANTRYFRYVAEKLIERGGETAERIEREVSAVRLTPKPYSTDIAAAWEVVERLQTLGIDCMVRRTSDGYWARAESVYGLWSASIDPRDGGPALAVCRAALAAVGAMEAPHG